VKAFLQFWASLQSRTDLRLFLRVLALDTLVCYSLLYVIYAFNAFYLASSVKLETEASRNILLLWFSVIVVAPVLEEYIFRYPAIRYACSQTPGRSRVVLFVAAISSVLFALVHSLGELKFPLVQFILGMFAFYLGFKTNIFYSMALHAVHNTLPLLFFALFRI
jgi:membrane protease YdiL (CAAX protease family)